MYVCVYVVYIDCAFHRRGCVLINERVVEEIWVRVRAQGLCSLSLSCPCVYIRKDL